jgi:hypothetical protein
MTVKAYLDSKKNASFSCPECKKPYTKNLLKFPKIGHASRIKCKCLCGNPFVITLERRKHYRKPIELTGGYHHERFQFRGGIAIKDISKSGAGITISAQRQMAVGDNLTLKFNLNDDKNSFVAKEAVIRKMEGNHLGVEFLSKTWDDDILSKYITS